jgi:hypothetical protein
MINKFLALYIWTFAGRLSSSYLNYNVPETGSVSVFRRTGYQIIPVLTMIYFLGIVCHYFYLERRVGDWILSPSSIIKPSLLGLIDRTIPCRRTPDITEDIIQYISQTQQKSPAGVKKRANSSAFKSLVPMTWFDGPLWTSIRAYCRDCG